MGKKLHVLNIFSFIKCISKLFLCISWTWHANLNIKIETWLIHNIYIISHKQLAYTYNNFKQILNLKLKNRTQICHSILIIHLTQRNSKNNPIMSIITKSFFILYYNMYIFLMDQVNYIFFICKLWHWKKFIVVVKRKILNVEKWVVSTQIIWLLFFAKIFRKNSI